MNKSNIRAARWYIIYIILYSSLVFFPYSSSLVSNTNIQKVQKWYQTNVHGRGLWCNCVHEKEDGILSGFCFEQSFSVPQHLIKVSKQQTEIAQSVSLQPLHLKVQGPELGSLQNVSSYPPFDILLLNNPCLTDQGNLVYLFFRN